MGHCKDCKWRVEIKDDEVRAPAGFLTCNQPKALLGYDHAKDMPVDGVWIENDEGWGWFVGPDFGCINFEIKESKNHD